ncbi:alpha,alpha-trehalose-phosphate synthase (UDP-forming) [Bradyrhizobium sp. CCBAU 51627]|uniref:alpha,alpha-trehalose-phosphate synthase (UDP-forming) n=1 Tax=Bradyrhizobium sp. CCBAU 51627 TaxID=1325088 RepID=UPI0023068EE6|nr:trehalose-6-phosphate synthase [Bradyrhizobium sp. CCBAU 51627]MDA9437305.1 alpha,alpha-trehalose-phosphate synthase [Bradyrhizobium sp. CCBAU 51627]
MPFRFRDFIRFGVFGIGVALIVAFGISPFAGGIVQQWSRSDVEARSRLVFNAIQLFLDRDIEDQSWDRLSDLFGRVAQDKKILAVGFCNHTGALIAPTPEMPASFRCDKIARSENESFSDVAGGGRRILVAAFPVNTTRGRSHLVILTDLSFASARSSQVLAYVLASLASVVLVLTVGTIIFAVFMLRSWMSSLRRAVDEVRLGTAGGHPPAASSAVDREIHKLLRRTEDFTSTRQIDWTPKALQELLHGVLPGAEVLVVSNREPYIHNRQGGGIVVQRPASGLVSALEPIMRACGGTWVAHGSGTADRETVDANDRIRVPEGAPAYALRRVWISDAEQDGYYYGFANEGLWPLCHIAFVRPSFRADDWRMYRQINQRFADAVVAEARTEDPVVLVQDYHFALVPKMIRQQLPKATIIAFWHIPWPNAETFSICPWRRDIIEGMLGSTILGFHTQFHCNNFVECVDRFVESRIDREVQAVSLSGHETKIRAYPISIEWPPSALESVPTQDKCRAEVLKDFDLAEGTKLIVGIERFDYTKGIPDRMRAIDALLTRDPSWKGRLAFIQVAAPTRSKLDTYSRLQSEAESLADAINSRHRGGQAPIRLVARHYESADVFKLFRAADVCVVSSLHDGMNLVAKEFVSSRDDNAGVLVLSSFTGASREMSEALIINPYDTEELAAAIKRAMTMPLEEQVERMKLMRQQVRENNVYRWAGTMLVDAARSRTRERILALTETGESSRSMTASARTPGPQPQARKQMGG